VKWILPATATIMIRITIARKRLDFRDKTTSPPYSRF